jgi:hypothetical protein
LVLPFSLISTGRFNASKLVLTKNGVTSGQVMRVRLPAAGDQPGGVDLGGASDQAAIGCVRSNIHI